MTTEAIVSCRGVDNSFVHAFSPNNNPLWSAKAGVTNGVSSVEPVDNTWLTF